MKSAQALPLLLIPTLLAPALSEAQQMPMTQPRMARAPMPVQQAAPAMDATTYPFVTFTIVTGGDDLRADSLVGAQIAFPSDHTEQKCALHSGAARGTDANTTWDNQSSHQALCKLDKPRTLAELKNARWTLTMLGETVGASPDNWNIKSIEVLASRSRADEKACILSLHADGLNDPDLIRLTGDQPTVKLAGYPNRCK